MHSLNTTPNKSWIVQNFWKIGTAVLAAALLAGGGFFASSYLRPAAGPQQAFAQKPKPAFPIRANRSSKIYHWKGCPNYDDIKDRNILEFDSAAAAEQSGFRAAKNCPTAKPKE